MGGGSALSFIDPEFNEFLFAPIGEQENGMTVSVFSALARLGLDPWREAKRLSELPMDGAVGVLGETIARVVDLQWAKIDAARIATRLVHLLPSNIGASPDATPQYAPARRPVGRSLPTIKIPALPVAAWLVIGGLIVAGLYFMSWSMDTSGADQQPPPTAPSSYDSPQQGDPGRR